MGGRRRSHAILHRWRPPPALVRSPGASRPVRRQEHQSRTNPHQSSHRGSGPVQDQALLGVKGRPASRTTCRSRQPPSADGTASRVACTRTESGTDSTRTRSRSTPLAPHSLSTVVSRQPRTLHNFPRYRNASGGEADASAEATGAWPLEAASSLPGKRSRAHAPAAIPRRRTPARVAALANGVLAITALRRCRVGRSARRSHADVLPLRTKLVLQQEDVGAEQDEAQPH